jgi:hypothetical protein
MRVILFFFLIMNSFINFHKIWCESYCRNDELSVWCCFFPYWTGFFSPLLNINTNCYDFSPPECTVQKDQMIFGP